jgi:hypothetical protein
MTHMASAPTSQLLAIDRRIATVGIVVGVLALAAGIVMLLTMIGGFFGLLDPTATALTIGQGLGLAGIAIMLAGALGNATVFATAPLRNRKRLTSVPEFFAAPPGDDTFPSSQEDVQPPPPRSKRGATATTRRPSED